MKDDELDDLIKRDPFAALCHVVRASGGTMRLHGVPIEEAPLRAAAIRIARDRIAARLAPAIVAGQRWPEEHW
jgi:hypothetical protein